jgi:hypothetical protein
MASVWGEAAHTPNLDLYRSGQHVNRDGESPTISRKGARCVKCEQPLPKHLSYHLDLAVYQELLGRIEIGFWI